jgi:predicted nucleotidyltransferase
LSPQCSASYAPRWYPLAVETAREIELPSGQSIRLIHAPLFIATKLEAFKGRGNADYLMSHDLEDIISVVDGRVELIEEMHSMPEELLRYLSDEFTQLINDPALIEALPGHLPGDLASQQRLPDLLNRLRTLSSLAR